MKINRRRTAGALLAQFAVASLTALQASANPQPSFMPGLCGNGAAYSLVNEKDAGVSIFGTGQALETTITNRADRKAGYEVNIDGLTPIVRGGGPWQSLTLKFRVGNPNSAAERANEITTSNVVIYMHAMDGKSVEKTLAELRVSFNRGNWQSLTLQPKDLRGFSKNEVVDRVFVYQRTTRDVFSRITFGDIQINYSNTQGPPEPGQLLLRTGKCADLAPNP